jgi:hypothetical protein
MKKLFKGGAYAIFLLAGAQGAWADTVDTLKDFLKESSFSGTVRAYDFNRIYSHDTQSAQPSQAAFSVGGMFNFQTAPFLGGVSLGASFFTANSLGLNDDDGGFAHLDATLAGTRSSINALGQAYIQYQNPWLLVKGGDQRINTPWLIDSDSRLLPSTYQGFFADATPLDNLHFSALRIFRWKSRTSNDYFQNNLYYAPTYDGDDLRGGGKAALATTGTQGALAFGTSYADYGVKFGLWYYNFEQFASMVFNDTTYTLKTGTGFDPFIGDQYVREWKGDSLLNGAAVNAIKGDGVDNVTYGLKGGLNSPYGQLMFSYTEISNHQGSVGNGALISPYTIGYTTDPLDTSSMIRGEVDEGPGHAWKVRYQKKLLEDRIVFIAAFARYYSDVYGSNNNALIDLAYYPGGFIKGFSVRNRAEDAVVDNAAAGGGLNPGKARVFFYDRVQLQYEF